MDVHGNFVGKCRPGAAAALRLSLCLLLIGCAYAAEAVALPLPDFVARPTPLSFGMYVTPDPAHNPIKPPEKFTGYHVGTDFEVSKEELGKDIPVFALCAGKVLYGGFAEGYGGVLVHQCLWNGEQITVIYGHLRLEGLPAQGSSVVAGQKIGVLAPARSHDSDGNRKHLHLGIHKGSALDMNGYVQTKGEIDQFIDVRTLLPAPTTVFSQPIVPYWQEAE